MVQLRKGASSQRPDIREQSYLNVKNALFAKEEESIYGRPFHQCRWLVSRRINLTMDTMEDIAAVGLVSMTHIDFRSMQHFPLEEFADPSGARPIPAAP